MVALVALGRLSNQLGRNPVAFAALAVTAVGTLVLTEVHSVAPLIAGRMLQGIGCGLASSALAAFIVDSAPRSPGWLASAVTTGSPMVGLTLGALASGALAEYGPAPRSLAYVLAPCALAGCAGLVLAARRSPAPRPRGGRCGRGSACRPPPAGCSPPRLPRSSPPGRSAASTRPSAPRSPPTSSARPTRWSSPS